MDIPKFIREFDSGLTKPRYEQRLSDPPRPELLNEYAHFIISRFKSRKDAGEWIKQATTPGQAADVAADSKLRKTIGQKIDELLKEERRRGKGK